MVVCYVRRQGEESSQDEKGASVILAAQLDSELGGSPVQVTFALLYVCWNIDQGCSLLLFYGKCSAEFSSDLP